MSFATAKEFHLTGDTQGVSRVAATMWSQRMDRQISQEQLAFSAGISVQAYGELERLRLHRLGARGPQLLTVTRVLQALGIDCIVRLGESQRLPLHAGSSLPGSG